MESRRPPRDRAIALGALGSLALATATRSPLAVALCVAVASASLAAGGAARAIAALTALLAVGATTRLPWQAVMALALGGAHMLARWSPSMAPSAQYRARGSVPVGATALVGGVTPFALGAGLALARPDLGDVLRGYVPDLPLPALIAGAAVFALVNAALEELIWRGVLTDRLETLFSSSVAVALQAASFGAQHAHGFPRGVSGVMLAGAWAVMLGALRLRSRGLAAPLIAHVVADTTIAVLVLAVVRR